MERQVLLVNDLPGYGKVALAAMFPILAQAGHGVFNLPTALVSNTLDYGRFEILETTAYMKNTLAVWRELGFRFDAICVGFIVSQEQTNLIADYVAGEREKGVWIFVDPIMGDDGKLYNGFSQQNVVCMRRLCAQADLAVPNFTEAAMLTGGDAQKSDLTRAEARQLLDDMRALGPKSVVITSAKVEGQDMVLGYDHTDRRYFEVPFTHIPVRFPGTGDIFSAIVISRVLGGVPLPQAVEAGVEKLHQLIFKNRHNPDKYKGIPLEECMDMLAPGGEWPVTP